MHIMKNKLFVSLSLLLIFACRPVSNYLEPDKPVYLGSFADPTVAVKDTIKVVTFNIR